MDIVSSTVGCSTITGKKRRSSAASFSMYLRYSFSVVAPIQCSSPRASIGLSRFPASMAPSVAPAPTMVCSSSMNRIICPSDSATSLSTALSRSSNSPLNLAPAMSAPMSSAIMRLSFMASGTSFFATRCARPSTMAVLPTPASPISTGLFFLRRERISIVRLISCSLPITGSSLPWDASSVKSIPYFFSGSIVSSGFSEVMRLPPLISLMAASNRSFVIPSPVSIFPATESFSSVIAISRCSTLTNSSCILPAVLLAESSTLLSVWVM
ncbi:MAG: hypothetical protein A4E23_01041 [Methanomethylovorans sp. PtaU1.Bin073]|nr:MAG: hypothetical protein A4E23_01041 [Methanomethylovorans sp. PtaU1.Bin073]